MKIGIYKTKQLAKKPLIAKSVHIYNISMVGTTRNDRTEKLGITPPKSLLRTIDNKRGDVPRSTHAKKHGIEVDGYTEQTWNEE
ncbi:MAG TPA: hypothetical protein VJ729_11200 [Nitrososphaeraceae archaeon]|nr:hypothetical protein [Nitrososphaeraceae archaeon]